MIVPDFGTLEGAFQVTALEYAGEHDGELAYELALEFGRAPSPSRRPERMVNRHRGEVEAVLDGRAWTLCLTLGALAELEAALAAGDLMGLARRFEEGRLTAGDAIRIIGAGLRGAGHDVDDAAVARMRAEGGATGFVAIVARAARGDVRGRRARRVSELTAVIPARSRNPRSRRDRCRPGNGSRRSPG